MDIKEVVKTKRFKNAVITVIEILIVAGIIFAVLMFFQNKVYQEADKAGERSGKGVSTETQKTEEGSNQYYIEINKQLNAVVVYQYSKDKKKKTPYKAFRCSIGKNIKNAKYKTNKKYMWLDINDSWHKYNTQIGDRIWIQSANYKDKYSYHVSKTSYREIGKKQPANQCILLTAGDAAWIYNHCKEKTEISIIKGSKKEQLEIGFSPKVAAYKDCGWDPTDPQKDNPYLKIEKEKIITGSDTVYIERGQEPNYLRNILVLDAKGKNITGKVKYKTIDYNTVGTYKVSYQCKISKEKTIKAKQKFVVIDTTPPKVSCSNRLYTLRVDSKDEKSIQNKENIKKIQNMVKSGVSCDEPVLKTEVFTVMEGELELDKKVPVVIKAQDKAGNVGSTQVMCEIKLKDNKLNKKYKPSKDLEKKRKEQKKKKEQNKKK